MDEIELNATLVKKHSEKKNTDYYVVEIEITENVKKQVFLTPAEIELVKLVYSE